MNILETDKKKLIRVTTKANNQKLWRLMQKKEELSKYQNALNGIYGPKNLRTDEFPETGCD